MWQQKSECSEATEGEGQSSEPRSRNGRESKGSPLGRSQQQQVGLQKFFLKTAFVQRSLNQRIKDEFENRKKLCLIIRRCQWTSDDGASGNGNKVATSTSK